MNKIKLIVYDFDGVLTDNRVLVSEDGVESVFCNRSDGWYIGKIRDLGIEQLILSTEANPVVSKRGQKLKLQVIQGQMKKLPVLQKLLEERHLSPEEVIYVGNEMNDLECLQYVGSPLAPQDAHPAIQDIAKVLPESGGRGIVRHIYDLIT